MDKQAARMPLKSGGDTELTVREGSTETSILGTPQQSPLSAQGALGSPDLSGLSALKLPVAPESPKGPKAPKSTKRPPLASASRPSRASRPSLMRQNTLAQSNEKWIREQKKSLEMVGFDLACARVQEKYEADYKPEPERGTCEYRIWRAKVSYESTSVQIIIALLIFANFVINAAEAQNPDSTDPIGNGIFLFFEYFFCIVFGMELIWNMAANWPCEFWCGAAAGWNWFDFIVVVVSMISLIASEVSDTEVPGVAVLRLLRAFRVFRLFKRLNSLRKIIKSIEGAMPGVANAFMILLLIMSIYAILGVELARDVHPRGDVYFGTFGKSLLSMFQVMTGESWSEAIARPLVVGPNGHWGFAFYFISYILICSFMMVNVAIAVLLEKFVEDDEADDDGGFQEITPLEAIDQLRGQLFPLRDKFTELNDRMDAVLRVSKKASNNRQPQRGRPGAPKQTSRARTRTLSSDRGLQ